MIPDRLGLVGMWGLRSLSVIGTAVPLAGQSDSGGPRGGGPQNRATGEHDRFPVAGGLDAVVVFAKALEVVDCRPAAAEWIGVIERSDVVELAAFRRSVAAGETAMAVA